MTRSAIRRSVLLTSTLVAVLGGALPAFAHETPEGSEWIMADFMFTSFAIFAGAAFIVFMIALKRGLLTDLEGAKYHILTIDEPDYYTPDWALDEEVPTT